MLNQEHLQDAIARGKREILSDIVQGRVPSDVSSFGQLHDYVDANEYGGLCDTYANEGDPTDSMSDEWIAFGNAVQDALNAWIVAGWMFDASAQEFLYDEYGMNAEDIAALIAHSARMLGGSDV